jgi:hypothetical protein
MKVMDWGESKSHWMIRKFATEEDFKNDNAYEESKIPLDGTWIQRVFNSFLRSIGLQRRGNILLNEGINQLWTLACSTGATPFDASNAYIGVGDSTASEAVSQTGLQASSNKFYKYMDSSFPTFGTSQLATWRATFGASEANYDWREFSLSNSNSDAGKNLNRKVSSQGTKAVSQVWQITLSIVLS